MKKQTNKQKLDNKTSMQSMTRKNVQLLVLWSKTRRSTQWSCVVRRTIPLVVIVTRTICRLATCNLQLATTTKNLFRSLRRQIIVPVAQTLFVYVRNNGAKLWLCWPNNKVWQAMEKELSQALLYVEYTHAMWVSLCFWVIVKIYFAVRRVYTGMLYLPTQIQKIRKWYNILQPVLGRIGQELSFYIHNLFTKIIL